jgi:hypothetical protein
MHHLLSHRSWHALRPGPTFRVRWRAVTASALVLVALGLLFATPAVRAARATDTGEIDGTLVDGTANNAPLAGQTVTLRRQAGSDVRAVGTAVTNAQGVFQFTGLATDQNTVYAATVTYQGATYSTDVLALTGNAALRVTLLAYEATASDALIGIGPVAVQVQAPNVQAGTIDVAELVTVVNAGQHTYVGAPGPASGKPMNLLRFTLPAGATNLVTRDGFAGAQIIQVNGGFATTATVPPGQTQFSFTYSYPYDGTRSIFTYRALYPTARVVLVAPRGLHVRGSVFTSTGMQAGAGQGVQIWQSLPVATGSSASVVLSNLPVPGQTSDLNPAALDALAALLAALALGAVGYYVKRGTGRAVPTATAAAAAVAVPPSAATATAMATDTSSEALLRALARLDQARAAGDLEEAPYRIQREALKAELKTRLLAETSITVSGAGESR